MPKITFLLLLFSQIALAQKIKVTDMETGQPIPDLYIFCENQSTITNHLGVVDLAKFRKCKKLTFQHPSYILTTLSTSQLKQMDYKVTMQESSVNLQEVELSYNKWEEDSRSIPIDITHIDSKEVNFLNPQTAADLLAASGEVFVQKSQLGGGSPMIRGFSTSRVLLVVDGVRMNNAIFREGNVQNVISLDANAIQSTEVIFGPGAVIYGSDALGGVMDFHTKDPQYSMDSSKNFKLGYLARTSSANFEKTGHVDFNIGGKKFAALTSITFTDYDDQIMGSHGPEDYLRPLYQDRIDGKDVILQNPNPRQQRHSGFSQLNLMQKLRWRPSSNIDLIYGFHYSTTSDIPRYDRLIQYAGTDTLRFADWHYGPQKWMMHNLQAHFTANNMLFDRVRATLAYQYFEESRHDRRIFSETMRRREENVDAYNASLDFEKKLSTKNSLYYGVEYVYNFVNSTGYSENISTGETAAVVSRYPDDATWQYSAGYLSYKYQALENLTFNFGARANFVMLRGELDRYQELPFDNIDNDFFAVNGSAGLSWLPDESLQIRANISNGFRAPNVDDAAKIFDSGDGIVVVPNPNLEAEYLYTADLGLLKTFGENFQFELSGFYSILDNALVRRKYSFNGRDSIIYDGELAEVHSLQNADGATVYGGQAAVKIQLIPQLHLRSSLHIIQGETNRRERLRHVAPAYGTGHLVFEAKKLKMDLYTMFNGGIDYENLAPSEQDKDFLYALDENGNPYSPSWATLNFKAEYQFAPALVLQAGVENILDRRYQPYSSGITAAGRNFIFAIRGNL